MGGRILLSRLLVPCFLASAGALGKDALHSRGGWATVKRMARPITGTGLSPPGRGQSNGGSRIARSAANLVTAPVPGADEKAVGSWPCGDALDRRIGLLAIPAILNFMIIPLVGAVDTCTCPAM